MKSKTKEEMASHSKTKSNYKSLMKKGFFEIAATLLHRVKSTSQLSDEEQVLYDMCLCRLSFLPPIDLTNDYCRILSTSQSIDQSMAPIVAEQILRHLKSKMFNHKHSKLLEYFAGNELFTLYLQSFFNVDISIEHKIRELRTTILDLSNDVFSCNASYYNLAVSLAIQACHSDYILDISEDELGKLATLEHECREKETDDYFEKTCFIKLAMYLPPTENLKQKFNSINSKTKVERKLSQHIDERLDYLGDANTVPLLFSRGNIKERAPVTEVKSQYENYPFPRWSNVLTSKSKRTFREHMEHRESSNKSISVPDNIDILVAGCGTGKHVISLAERYYYSTITAIDFSATSLKYARMKVDRATYPDIEFYQADILELTNWERQFHLIESVGVIHHTIDPIRTLKVLVDLLNQGGWMKIGVYSRLARRYIEFARQVIAEENFSDDIEGMRAFRNFVLKSRETSDLRKLIHYADFYNTNHLKDLAFNACEKVFDIPQLKAMLELLGLEFRGFQLDNKRHLSKYRSIFPEDQAGINLDNWASFETENPDTFIGMYQFWCKKK
ncbi:bifunctional 2-polyprenyl-6-hydroxyphenol methylase/3-demethylubiquinol 3-O-methyltransferase UbiG [Alteromonas sp. KUL42]|uniref:class I SAM-dependent methyltransferase n=1 Tax=Alteromonas sp. KUL42 TaxID=2480797 RepID=UPI0013EF72E4|nr:class I SAM-dependent methyltransferase [Alteromonas sp. KUL42]